MPVHMANARCTRVREHFGEQLAPYNCPRPLSSFGSCLQERVVVQAWDLEGASFGEDAASLTLAQLILLHNLIRCQDPCACALCRLI